MTSYRWVALNDARTSSPHPPHRILTYADSTQSFGAETVFCDVVRALSRVPDFQVTAAVPLENEILCGAVHDMAGVGVIDVSGHPPKRIPIGVWDPRRGLAIRESLAKGAWDVMFLNLPSVEYGAAPLLWARGTCAASIGIMHLHHSIQSMSVERPLGGLRDRLAGRLLRRLDHALVISPRAPHSVARTWGLPMESCSVLPLLARQPVRVNRAEARQRLGLPAEATVVGMVARIDIGQKGHDVFVAAAGRMARDDPSIRFAIAGEGPDEPRLREMTAESGLADRFHFLGTVRPPDVALGALDAIAFPSRFEGLPLTAIEALSVGLPGVASRVDGLAAVWPPEWTTGPDDAAGLAQQLKEVLSCTPAQRDDVLKKAGGRAQQLLTDDLVPVLAPLVRRVSPLKRRPASEAVRST